MNIKNLIIIASMVMLNTQVLAGGGWTKEKGKAFVKFNQFWVNADSYYSPDGTIIPVQPDISLYTTSIYAEYGITDKLTGIAYLPLFSRATLNEFVRLNGDVVAGDALNSLGDADFTLKYGLIQNKPIVVSASLTLGIPLGVARGGDSNTLATGDGEFNQMISIEASHSFYPFPAYISTVVSLNNRTRNTSEEFRYGVEGGVTLFKKFTAIARLYTVTSLNNSDFDNNDLDPNRAPQSIFSNNIEFMSFTTEFAYDFSDKFGISISQGTAFSGQRILADPTFTVGAYLNL